MSTYYFLTLEAIDDAGVVEVYQALVWNSCGMTDMELILFGLVIDNKSLLKLIDRRRIPGIGLPFDNRGNLLLMACQLLKLFSLQSICTKKPIDNRGNIDSVRLN